MKEQDETPVIVRARASGLPAAGPFACTSAETSADAAFSAVFDSSGEALLVVDADGLVKRANLRAHELLRLKEVPLRQPALSDLLELPQTDQPLLIWRQFFSAARMRSLDALLPTGFPLRFTQEMCKVPSSSE